MTVKTLSCGYHDAPRTRTRTGVQCFSMVNLELHSHLTFGRIGSVKLSKFDC